MNRAYPWKGGASSPVYQEWERQELAAERSARDRLRVSDSEIADNIRAIRIARGEVSE